MVLNQFLMQPASTLARTLSFLETIHVILSAWSCTPLSLATTSWHIFNQRLSLLSSAFKGQLTPISTAQGWVEQGSCKFASIQLHLNLAISAASMKHCSALGLQTNVSTGVKGTCFILR